MNRQISNNDLAHNFQSRIEKIRADERKFSSAYQSRIQEKQKTSEEQKEPTDDSKEPAKWETVKTDIESAAEIINEAIRSGKPLTEANTDSLGKIYQLTPELVQAAKDGDKTAQYYLNYIKKIKKSEKLLEKGRIPEPLSAVLSQSEVRQAEEERRRRKEEERKQRWEYKRTVPQLQADAKKGETDEVPFPDNLEEVEFVRDLANGTKLVRDKNGNQFVMSSAGSNEETTKDALLNNANAANFYDTMGGGAPPTRLYDNNGISLSVYIEDGQSLNDWFNKATQDERAEMQRKLRGMFAADVLMGNSGVFDSDNILIDKNGNPWRVNNSGAFGGKNNEPWRSGMPDELWTMTGRGKNIGADDSNSITRYIGSVNLVDIAEAINDSDWQIAIQALPKDEQEILQKRLDEIRKIAVRGKQHIECHFTLEASEEILDHSYTLTKRGTCEKLPEKIDIVNGKEKDNYGVFQSVDPETSVWIINRDYCNEDGPEGYETVNAWGESQGCASYGEWACRKKVCLLYSKGIDILDEDTSVDGILEEIKRRGYYTGVEDGGREQKTLAINLREQIEWYRKNPERFQRHRTAFAKNHSLNQLILENTGFFGNNMDERSVTVNRTESVGVIKNPKIGETAEYPQGVGACESTSVKNIVMIGSQDKELVMADIKYPDIQGLFFVRRDYNPDCPEDGECFFTGFRQTEVDVDMVGARFIYMGRLDHKQNYTSIDEYVRKFRKFRK